MTFCMSPWSFLSIFLDYTELIKRDREIARNLNCTFQIESKLTFCKRREKKLWDQNLGLERKKHSWCKEVVGKPLKGNGRNFEFRNNFDTFLFHPFFDTFLFSSIFSIHFLKTKMRVTRPKTSQNFDLKQIELK